MQQKNDTDQPPVSSDNHCDQGEQLTKRDVIGGVLLITCVAGALSGYYAYNYISKDSARMQFWIGFMFSFIGVLVVTLQVAIYAQQARFMRQQVNTSRIAERGYMGIEKANLLKELAVGERPIVRIIFRNGGRTPIWNMMHPTRMRIGAIFPTGRPRQFRAEGGGFLPAGLTREVEFIIDRPITEELMDDIVNDRIKIFVNGESHFRDCWNEKRIEPFRLVYVPRLEMFAEYFPHAEDFEEQDGALVVASKKPHP